MSESEIDFQVVLIAVHAITFVVLAVWCLRNLSAGRWARLGAAGAGLLGLSLGILAASTVENAFFDSARIAVNLLVRDHVYTVLLAAEAVGAVLLVLAFVESRRTPSAPDSIYGPS